MEENAKSNVVFKSSVLRAELMKKSLKVLRQEAIDEGIDERMVDVALMGNDKKTLVNLMVENRKKRRQKGKKGSEPEDIFQKLLIELKISEYSKEITIFITIVVWISIISLINKHLKDNIPNELLYAIYGLTLAIPMTLFESAKNYFKQIGDEYDKNDKRNDGATTITGIGTYTLLLALSILLFTTSESWAELTEPKNEAEFQLADKFVKLIASVFAVFFGYFAIKNIYIFTSRDFTRLNKIEPGNFFRKNITRFQVIITIIYACVIFYYTAHWWPGMSDDELFGDEEYITKKATFIWVVIMIITSLYDYVGTQIGWVTGGKFGHSDDAAVVKTELEILFKNNDRSQLKNIPDLLIDYEGREWVLLSEKKAELGVDIPEVTQRLEELYRDTNLEHKIEKIPSILKRAKDEGEDLYVWLERTREKHKDKIKPKPKPKPKPPRDKRHDLLWEGWFD